MTRRASSRREFLADVAALGVGAALGLALGCGGNDRSAALLAIFSDPDAARAVGREVLRAEPGWNDEGALAEALLASPAWDRGAPPGEVLTERIRGDFSAGRVVSVRGWWLAETEARLFALAALRG